MRVSLSLFYKLRFVSLSLYFYLFLSSTYLSNPYIRVSNIKFLVRIANQMGEDSRCREGMVHSRVGFSRAHSVRRDARARSVRRESPKALWRFRVSTANSPSGRTWLHPYTLLRHIDHTYVQQDIQVYEGDQI